MAGNEEHKQQVTHESAQTFPPGTVHWVRRHLKKGTRGRPHRMPPDRLAFYQSTLKGERAALPLPVSSNIYEGEWYQQRGPTCVAWAVVNGFHVVGAAMHEQFFHTLHMLPLEKDRISLHTAAKLQGEFPDLQAALHRAQDGVSTLPEQAVFFKQTIDAGNVAVVSVKTALYRGVSDENLKGHAICVVGYRAIESKEPGKTVMDLQVVDPSVGKIWMGAEHLSRAINKDKIYTLTKKTVPDNLPARRSGVSEGK